MSIIFSCRLDKRREVLGDERMSSSVLPNFEDKKQSNKAKASLAKVKKSTSKVDTKGKNKGFIKKAS